MALDPRKCLMGKTWAFVEVDSGQQTSFRGFKVEGVRALEDKRFIRNE